ncbi:hypothetical protein CCHR01_14230 [Colletotrichum chrysophilum]|uniref:Uncharacterized protein n=1 Tax=Colletotrichum chrysophilum TaxID=1836956 RepID=A0AAD9ACS9_9PEZI|nr:hypothetical protein CCHR01_14230 [Colletotrichum chrysophilum]
MSCLKPCFLPGLKIHRPHLGEKLRGEGVTLRISDHSGHAGKFAPSPLNRLRCADGKRIDLAFMLTCKKIASETRGLALSSNILNFVAVCPSEKEHRAVAGRFGLALTTLSQRRSHKLHQIYPDTLNIPDDIWRDISEIEPKLAPYVELLQRRPNGWRVMDGASHMMPTIIERPEIGWPGTCGETPSVFRKFARSALQVLLANKDRFEPEEFLQFERGMLRWHETEHAGIVGVNPDAWEIPTTQSLDRDSRLSIRKIILNEDRAAVAFPEAHGLGLIPYCQENPRLRVERRVSMWKTVFQTQFDGRNIHVRPYDSNDGLWADSVSRPVALWILEALELEPAGMPPGAFTLTFEGDQKCWEIFRTVVQRDAAWQAAVDLSLKRQILPSLSWVTRRLDGWAHIGSLSKWHVLEGFPQAVQDIVAGKSTVKCNFDVGEAWDVEKLVEERKDWTMSDWKERWKRGFGVRFDPDPPSPKYLHLLCDNTFEMNVPIDPAAF